MLETDDVPTTSKGERYLYAMIDAAGTAWVLVDGGTHKVEGIPWLVRQGWRPIRETPFAAPSSPYILICFEHV